MDEPPLVIALIALGVLVGAICSSAESGLRSLGELRLRAIREEGGRWSKSAARILQGGVGVYSRLLVGRLLGVTLSAAASVYLAYRSGGTVALWVGTATFVLAYSALLQLANAFVQERADRLAFVVLIIARPLELLVAPLAYPIEVISKLTGVQTPRPPNVESERLAEREVEQAIAHGREEGVLTREHAALLRSALEFKHTLAREVMVPRRKIIAFEISTPLEEVIAAVREEGHSRFPVYRERLDQIEGILFAKDLLKALIDGALIDGRKLRTLSLGDVVRRPAFFCGENRRVGLLLREMQTRRTHIALVVDEFGGTSGLITLEDIIEEIVGDIQDEDDEEELAIRELEPGRYLVDAELSLYDLEEHLGERIQEETDAFDSVGGLLVDRVGKVPQVGESIVEGSFEFVIRGADRHRVTRVEIARTGPIEEPRNSATG